VIERAEALIKEECLQATATTPCDFNEPQRECQAGEERLSTGEGLSVAWLTGQPVNDLEVLREAIARTGHLPEDRRSDTEECQLLTLDDVANKLRVAEQRDEFLELDR